MESSIRTTFYFFAARGCCTLCEIYPLCFLLGNKIIIIIIIIIIIPPWGQSLGPQGGQNAEIHAPFYYYFGHSEAKLFWGKVCKKHLESYVVVSKIFWNFHPETWGNGPTWLTFSDGLKPPTRQSFQPGFCWREFEGGSCGVNSHNSIKSNANNDSHFDRLTGSPSFCKA